VTAVDSLAAASAHQNIFGVIGHANHFMRHNLAYRKNQVESALDNEPIHLRRPGKVELALGLLVNELRRHLAERDDIGAPAVHAKKVMRHVAEHVVDLRRLHRRVRPDGG